MNHSDHKIIRHFGVRQHGKFVFWQPILATMNLLSYKLENLFLIPDPTVSMAISELVGATRKICFPTITHSHLSSPSYKTIFPDGAAGFSYLLSNSSRQIYVQLCRNHTHFDSVHPQIFDTNTDIDTGLRLRYNSITSYQWERQWWSFKMYWKALNSCILLPVK